VTGVVGTAGPPGRPECGTLFVGDASRIDMRWRLFATLAEAAGDTEVPIDVEPGATVGDAFDALLDAHPDLADEVLDEEGDLYDHVRLLHEGCDPFAEGDGFDTTVEEGDELALFPPVSGG
jgi:molybdopterin synthase sulfur carrier subunit